MQSAFHVTPQGNLPQIMLEGLVPKLGPRSQDFGEEEAAVFLFPDRESCEDALGNWLGEYFEDEDENLAVLEVRIPADAVRYSVVGYEIVVLDRIPPECIQRVLEDAPGGFAELPFVVS